MEQSVYVLKALMKFLGLEHAEKIAAQVKFQMVCVNVSLAIK